MFNRILDFSAVYQLIHGTLCAPTIIALIPFWQDAVSKNPYLTGSSIRIANYIKITGKLWILDSQKKQNMEHTEQSLKLESSGRMIFVYTFGCLKIFLMSFFTFLTIFLIATKEMLTFHICIKQAIFN